MADPGEDAWRAVPERALHAATAHHLRPVPHGNVLRTAGAGPAGQCDQARAQPGPMRGEY